MAYAKYGNQQRVVCQYALNCDEVTYHSALYDASLGRHRNRLPFR